MTFDPKGRPDDPGRSDEAQDPDREGGLGKPATPPGQDVDVPATKPVEEPEEPEAEPKA